MINDVILICDDNYCLPTAVCIKSIIDNYQHSQYLTVHVCTTGLSDANMQIIEKLKCERVNVCVDNFASFFDDNRISSVTQKSHVTPTALIKFELANYFVGLDGALYLDSDIIVKGKIDDLLNEDISEYYLAASFEFYSHLERISYSLKRDESEEFYFNSGVMLMNFNLMREDDIPAKLWHHKLYSTKTKLMDQESLNSVCGAKVKHLPIKWNFNPVFLNNIYIKEINKVYQTDYVSKEDVIKDVMIIHYVGKFDKPWVYANARCRNYWDVFFGRLNLNYKIDLKKAEIANVSTFNSIKDRIRQHGIGGFACFIINKLLNRIAL